MKDLYILSLHLAYGGLQKAVAEFANLMAERYRVHILSFYDMPSGPAYPIDSRVQIRYLYNDIPNREEFKAALHAKRPFSVLKEGIRASKTLVAKRTEMIRAIKGVTSGIIVSTRDEYAVLLSRYGHKDVIKIAQLHQDYAYEKQMARHFAHDYGNIDLFTLLSPKMAEEAKEIMKNNRHTRVAYVPNFIMEIPPEAEPAEKRKEVIAVGRLHPVKGFDRLVRSFAALHAEFPEWTLRIVGDGEAYQTIQNAVHDCKAEEYVVLAGKYSQEQITDAMAKASVYALSSYSEGFPYVLLEAMAGSLPIAAYNTRGGLEMLVKHRENGFLVQTEEEFREALAMLMRDDELRETMGRESRGLLQSFTGKAVAETWFQLIEELEHERKV